MNEADEWQNERKGSTFFTRTIKRMRRNKGASNMET
jgi:hypothetical protein